MKASARRKYIKRPKASVVWVIWVIYGIICLTLQTIYFWGSPPPSPTTWLQQLVEFLSLIYLGGTALVIIYCIMRPKAVIKQNPTNRIDAESPDLGETNLVKERINESAQATSVTTPASSIPTSHQNQDADQAVDFLQRLLVLFELGKMGQATIQGVGYTGAFIGRHPFLKLHLLINQKGKSPLKLVACTLVNKHLIPRIGDHCNIMYLSGDHPIVVILDFM